MHHHRSPSELSEIKASRKTSLFATEQQAVADLWASLYAEPLITAVEAYQTHAGFNYHVAPHTPGVQIKASIVDSKGWPLERHFNPASFNNITRAEFTITVKPETPSILEFQDLDPTGKVVTRTIQGTYDLLQKGLADWFNLYTQVEVLVPVAPPIADETPAEITDTSPPEEPASSRTLNIPRRFEVAA